MVVGQLEPGILARKAHEHVDRLVPDGHPRHLLEAELLVEGNRAIDVADPVAGVEVGGHGRSLPGGEICTAAPLRRHNEGRCKTSEPERRGRTCRRFPPQRWSTSDL